MATVRQRSNGSWEYIIKCKAVREKPFYLYFDDREEGDRVVPKVEALLRQGIIPEVLQSEGETQFEVVADVIREYLNNNSVPESDRRCLGVVYGRIGMERLNRIDYAWVEAWIAGMKRERNLSPSTIRHHVGSLARCFDWGSKRKIATLAVNPIRLLPRRYATYSEMDRRIVQKIEGMEVRCDDKRDRRLEQEEERLIREVLDGKKPEDKERPLELKYRAALECMFDLALESAMRMREMYTLGLDQIDFGKRTVFLEKTKNGDKRQVPLTTVAVASLKTYKTHVKNGTRGMKDFNFEDGRLFPWWDGDLDSTALRRITSKLSNQYARIFEQAGADDFHFHDTRHEATSRIYERTTLSDLEISKITGHKDLRTLARYANLRGSNLAVKLW